MSQHHARRRRDGHDRYKRRRSSSSSLSRSSSYSSSLSSTSSSSLANSDRGRRSRPHRHRSDDRDNRHEHGGVLGRHRPRGLLSISSSSSSSSIPDLVPEHRTYQGGQGLLDLPMPVKAQRRAVLEADALSHGWDSDAVDDALSPHADWVCVICSNLNSAQRVECYRCGISYGRNCQACPNSELVVRNVLPDLSSAGDPTAAEAQGKSSAPPGLSPAQNVVEAEEMVLAALSAALAAHHEILETTAVATRGRSVYVRLPSVEAATRALVLCRCALTLGKRDQKCVMAYSSKGVTPPVVGSAGILGEAARDAEGVTEGAMNASTDPALANVPRELWPQHWEAPASFASAEEERQYLQLLSTHWGTLSSQQKAYYDDTVKRALARGEGDDSTESKMTPPSPQGAASQPATGSTTSPAAPLAVSDIKRRLAERKAALTAKGAAPPPAPVTPTNTAVSSLKQRLAQKKAQLASATAAVEASESCTAGPAAATNATAPSPPSGDCEHSRPRMLLGFPLPPTAEGDDSAGTAGVIVSGMPWVVAQRVVAPTTLLSAVYAQTRQA